MRVTLPLRMQFISKVAPLLGERICRKVRFLHNILGIIVVSKLRVVDALGEFDLM